MKYLIMCEGPNEKTILDLLLNNKKLKFNQNDLLGLQIYHARQLIPFIQTEIKSYHSNDFKIIRVIDKDNDNFKIPDSISSFVKKENIIICRTKPELEILLIIDNGLVKEFNKVKSNTKAKTFAKEYISFNKIKYDCSCKFWEDYYHNRLNRLVDNIIKQKHFAKNNKKEIYLADLLKKQ